MPSDQRIRVLFVSKWLDVGGAERFVSTVLMKLDPNEFEPHLVLFRDIVGYPLPKHVSVRVLHPALVHKAWHIPRLVVRLARAIRDLQPDVVVSAYGYPNIITGFALRLIRGGPQWLARVSTNPDWEEAGLRRPLFRFAYRRADRFVANSARLGELFSSIYPKARGRVWHLPNPADFDAIEAAVNQPPKVTPAARPRLVAVGRLAEAKRIDLLVQAVNIVSQAHDVELVLCGDGTLRADLMSLVEGLGLADRVAFAGYGNPFPWVASADLFVLSSDHEGSPNALIEANGLGVPAVSTDCDFGPSEIIEDGTTGWLVGVGDVDALATTIGRVISDRALLTVAGAAARDRARVLFDASTVTHMLAQHLKDLSGVGKSDRLVPMNAESERFSHPHRSTNSESNVPPEA